MRISLTRTLRFHASHRYAKPGWSGPANRAAFGTAGDEHYHHYSCAVTVSGPPDPETGMVLDLGVLDRLLAEAVTRRFDGRALHREVPEFSAGALLPSCEALARDVFTRLEPQLPPGITLERVRIAEDETLSAECSRQ